jgi:hypothetical protein
MLPALLLSSVFALVPGRVAGSMATTPTVLLDGTFHYRLMQTNVDPDGKTSISNATWELVATGNASFAGRTGLTRLEFIDPGESGDSFPQ